MNNILNLFGVKKEENKKIGVHIIGTRKYTIYKDKKGRYYMTGGKKKYLKKGTRLSTVIKTKQPIKKSNPKKKELKKRGPKKNKDYSKVKIKSPVKKLVKNKNKEVVGKRLSARHVYDTEGKKALGKKFRILQKDGTFKVKVLKLRQNGSPYFANKFGNQVKFPLDLKIHGPALDDLTGYKNSWPYYPHVIAPSGVLQPDKMHLFPKGVHFHKNSFGKKVMCFG